MSAAQMLRFTPQPLNFLPHSVGESLVMGRMQHVKHNDSTLALLKECKIHVLEIDSVGQTVY